MLPAITKGIIAFVEIGNHAFLVRGTGSECEPLNGVIVPERATAVKLHDLGHPFKRVADGQYFVFAKIDFESPTTEEHYVFDCEGNCKGVSSYNVPSTKAMEELRQHIQQVKEEEIASRKTAFENLFNQYSLDEGLSSLIPRNKLGKFLLVDGYCYVCIISTDDKKVSRVSDVLYVRISKVSSDPNVTVAVPIAVKVTTEDCKILAKRLQSSGLKVQNVFIKLIA